MQFTSDIEWYVMRATYQRELIAQGVLDSMGIENFVPTVLMEKKQKKGLQEVSMMHNYIFIRTSIQELQEIKTTKLPYLRYLMDNGTNGEPEAQFVPADQMENFMAVCRSEGAKLLNPDINLRSGDRVRILEGHLAGVEGIYLKVSAKNEKRVVVKIDGIAAVATAAIPASQVKKI